jgi:DNA-binding transcriptional regulator/RsmH inhibitor MraZ
MKLSRQFKSGGTGGKRISDTIGAGSEDWDENAKALIPKGVRERAKVSVEDMLVGQKMSGMFHKKDWL